MLELLSLMVVLIPSLLFIICLVLWLLGKASEVDLEDSPIFDDIDAKDK